MIQLSKFLRPFSYVRGTAVAETRLLCSTDSQYSAETDPQIPPEAAASAAFNFDTMLEIDEAKIIKGPEKDIKDWNFTCAQHDFITYLDYDQDSVKHMEDTLIEHDYYIAQTNKRVRRKSSLLKLISQYPKNYSEKMILLHPDTAKRVADKIAANTEADPTSTWLIDGEGGFSLVAEQLMRGGTFSKLKICSRDENLIGSETTNYVNCSLPIKIVLFYVFCRSAQQGCRNSV